MEALGFCECVQEITIFHFSAYMKYYVPFHLKCIHLLSSHVFKCYQYIYICQDIYTQNFCQTYIHVLSQTLYIIVISSLRALEKNTMFFRFLVNGSFKK